MRKLTLEHVVNFILNAHPGSEVLSKEYINSKNKLKLRCENGHEFESIFPNLRKGSWCIHCANKSKGDYHKLDLEHIKQFVKKNYINSEVLSKEYINSKNKLRFRCEKGHEFESIFPSIRKGHWCPECAIIKNSNKLKLNLTEVRNNILKWHPGSKLLSHKYTNNQTKLHLICENNHEFKQCYSDIQQGGWCMKCAINKRADNCRLTFLEVKNNIIEWHPESIILFDKYVSAHNKLKIQCKNGHIFNQSYNNIQQGRWCKYCLYRNEQECREILEGLLFTELPRKRPKFMKGLELDGYSEDLKFAFEYNGEQHYKHVKHFHRTPKKQLKHQQERDKLKQELCLEHGIELLIIPYWVKNKREFINNYLCTY